MHTARSLKLISLSLFVVALASPVFADYTEKSDISICVTYSADPNFTTGFTEYGTATDSYIGGVTTYSVDMNGPLQDDSLLAQIFYGSAFSDLPSTFSWPLLINDGIYGNVYGTIGTEAPPSHGFEVADLGSTAIFTVLGLTTLFLLSRRALFAQGRIGT